MITSNRQVAASSQGVGNYPNGVSSKPSPTPRDRQLLLVEDNQINQMVGLSLLHKLGYNVDLVSNGQEAIHALQHQHYDLVLMDIQMPGMDGLEATMIIRNPQSPVRDHSIPVIAISASVLPSDREVCLKSGMNDFISKPVRREELATVLERWLALVIPA